MRILFVEHINVMLGIESLSAYLKREGHEVEGFFDPGLFADSLTPNHFLGEFFNHRRPLLDHIERFRPQLICFSVVTDYFQWALRMARAIKAHYPIPIVFGGIHPTSVPAEVLAHPEADYVVVGEGEGALADLARALESGAAVDDIANLGFRRDGEVRINPLRPLIADLNALPYPDKELFGALWPKLYHGRYHTIASRGCPNRCTYCCHSFLPKMYQGLGPYYRVRSVEHFIGELELAKNKYRARTISIHDNALIVNRRWFRRFAEEYRRRINLPYFCWLSPDTVDEETVSLLEDSNCATVWIGVTRPPGASHDPGKRARFDDCLTHTLSLLHRNKKIFVIADNIIGMPYQESADLRDLIRLYLDHPVDNIIAFFLRYYPKTELIETALACGNVTEAQVRTIEREGLTRSFILPDQLTTDQFRRLSNLLLYTCLLPRGLVRWFLASDRRLRLIPRLPLWIVQQVINDIWARMRYGKQRIPLIAIHYQTAVNYLRFMLKRIFYRPAGKDRR